MAKQTDNTKIAGYIFIGLGTLFMFNEISRWIGINLLAGTILIPGVFMLRNVFIAYRKRSKLSNNDLLQGGLGLLLLVIGLSNLFDVQLNIFANIWPLAMIAIGLYVIFGQRQRS